MNEGFIAQLMQSYANLWFFKQENVLAEAMVSSFMDQVWFRICGYEYRWIGTRKVHQWMQTE